MKYAFILLLSALFISSNEKTRPEVVYVAGCEAVEITGYKSEWSNCGSILMTTYKNHEPLNNNTDSISTGEKIKDKYNVPPIVAFPEHLEKKLGLQLGDTILIKDGDKTYKKVFKDRMDKRISNRIDLMINEDEPFYSRRVVYYIKR